ncbi:hypothetical protein [Clostridium perfringens]|uniref:hypothetical protein n=1 Tax=Clostridium perfringens TaxID=1502 RepID=UPI0024BCF632|nr:hypothetical protein [Clostridium perfringens]
MNNFKVDQDRFLMTKTFLDTEAIAMSKETSLKILMRQYKMDRLEALLIYNKWRRIWCDTSNNKKLE